MIDKNDFLEYKKRTADDLRAIAKEFQDLAAQVDEGDVGAVDRFFATQLDENGETKFERLFFMFHWRFKISEA